MHQRERSVVADRADVAEMIGQPLQLGHQRAQVDPRAAAPSTCKRGFGRLREGKRIGDRAVAGSRARQACAASSSVAPFIRDSMPLCTQPSRCSSRTTVFAIGGEAEMSRLDDAGMHRPDRDLMQPLALRPAGICTGAGLRAGPLITERMPHAPKAKIEPGPRDRAYPSASSPNRSRIARSSRIAGGWRAAPIGYLPSLHAKLTTAISPDVSSNKRHVNVPVRRPRGQAACNGRPASKLNRHAASHRQPQSRAAKADALRPVSLCVMLVEHAAHRRYPNSRATFWKPGDQRRRHDRCRP